MITLGQARERVTERLAETSGVFWSEEARNRAINDAARLVATLTKGVTKTYSIPANNFAHNFGNDILAGINHISASFVTGSSIVIVPAVSFTEASKVSRNFSFFAGSAPRWLVVDESNGTAFLRPIPPAPFPSWNITANVIPAPVQNDNDNLFLGNSSMDKYITPTVLLACAYLLLQERFDGDAERFYQLGLQELTMLGVDSTTIPPLQGGIGPKQVA